MMNTNIGQTIRKLRLSMNISQETLARALGVTVQSISKWETQKALPEIMLLPKIAHYFDVTIDSLFGESIVGDDILSASVCENIAINKYAWNNIALGDWIGTHLPAWGVCFPNENILHLLDDITGKNVLEIACGEGQSLLYCSKKNPRELWGVDISEKQIGKAEKLFKTNNVNANLICAAMENNSGIPEQYFDCVYSIYGIGWTQDLDKTIFLISKYLKKKGSFIFSWDNPMLSCIDTINGQYVVQHSYVNERRIRKKQRGQNVVLTNWKISSYINSLVKYGFKIEQMVEESSEISDEAVFTEEYYSEYKAQFIHHSFLIKARKM